MAQRWSLMSAQVAQPNEGRWAGAKARTISAATKGEQGKLSPNTVNVMSIPAVL
jgi:hypothetical protein